MGDPDTPTYSNNRRSDRAYDAEGNEISGGWAPYQTHDYDAAGKQVHLYEESWSGPAEFWVYHQNTIDQVYSGVGQPGKRVETRHSEDYQGTITNEVRTVHYLRSSVLGGVVIAELDQWGGREGHVYAGGEKIADYNGWAPYGWMDFRHANPANGNWVSVHLPGNGGSRTEFDPLGATVGVFDPFPSQLTYNDMVGGEFLYAELGNPFDLGGGCPRLDGMPISCSELRRRMEIGAVADRRIGEHLPIELVAGIARVWIPDPDGRRLGPSPDYGDRIVINHDEDDQLGHYEYLNYGFGQAPQRPGRAPTRPVVPIENLRKNIEAKLNTGNCGKFVQQLLDKAAAMFPGSSPRAKTILEAFDNISSQGGYVLTEGLSYHTVSGNYYVHRETGGAAWALSAMVHIMPWYNLSGRAPTARTTAMAQAFYVKVALHETFHRAARGGYDDEQLAQAVSELTGRPGLPKPGSSVWAFTNYWDDELLKHCPETKVK